MEALERVRRAAARRDAATTAWRDAIREAVAAKESLRKVGLAAGITHVRVLQIIRNDPTNPDPEYHRAHRAVEKARGKSKECEHCGATGADKLYEWANLTGNYADVNDYRRLCRSCHRAYDRERRQITRE